VVVEENGWVTELSFRDSSVLHDEEWKQIGQLSHLKKLTTYGKAHGLNDQTVGYLLDLEQLESLSTDGAQLSDAGLAQLAGMKKLKSAAFFHLSFRMEGFTGEGFRAWKELKSLERLTVAGMSMGDDGFAAISEITSLQELSTWHTYQTEAGNAHIVRLPHLRYLKLGQRLPRGKGLPPSLSDATIRTLTQMPAVEKLQIGEARLTFDALVQLKSLKTLKELTIYSTDIPVIQIDALRKEMSGVKIRHEPITPEQKTRLDSYLQ
ncbi:MAG: hypothetical protein KDA91_05150, partial [Planctomycetaceae bacterium]|nr:hypothetical protein [Planctomycetaceae bacterium]